MHCPRSHLGLAILIVISGIANESVFAQFGMPESEKTSWTASWIWRQGDRFTNDWTVFRKTFDLGQVPASAPASIAVDSKYWLWINEELVVLEGGLKRGPTPEDTYYDEVDIAPYLRQGANVIAVLAWYFGKDGYSHLDSGRGGLLFEADLASQIIRSDESWKARRHPAFETSGPPVADHRLPEHNIGFDASRRLTGWQSEGYDEAGWEAAVQLGVPPTGPWNSLEPRPIPLWKDFGLRSYVNDADLPSTGGPDTIMAELPYNAQVMPYMRLRAPAGRVIDIRTDHYVIVGVTGSGGSYNIRARYVTREGEQEFEVPAWMNGHHVRYAIPEGVEILELAYRETGYDTEFTGEFESSNERLNSLWEKARRTNYVTMRDYFMETAGRERKQATGDGTIAILSALYSMDEQSHLLMRKFWREFAAWRKEGTVFRSGVPGNWETELAQQNLFAFGELGIWQYYLHTGDVETIEELYPSIRDYLFLWNVGADGLVEHREGDWDWFDWYDNIDQPPIENALYYLALRGATKMAALTGHQNDVVAFDERMRAIREVYNERFWRSTQYRSDSQGRIPDDRANAMAVLAKLYEEAMVLDIARLLNREKHAGPYMENMVVQSLFELGYPRSALRRLEERYSDMIDSPMSTLWEFWEPDRASLNHEFGTGTLSLLSGYVAGVRPEDSGYSTYKVGPNLGDLTNARVVVPTVRGAIRSSIRIDDPDDRAVPGVVMELDSPAETQAIVGVPRQVSGIERIHANGEEVWSDGEATARSGITLQSEDEQYIWFNVQPGSWLIEAFLKPSPARFAGVRTLSEADQMFLEWTTSREIDNTGFEVQSRLNDTYQTIGFVAGGGNGTETTSYRFALPQLESGRHTFRLKAIGVEGTVSFSEEVQFELPMRGRYALGSVFPNPFRTSASITLVVEEAEHVLVEVANILGRRVALLHNDFVTPEEQYRFALDAAGLPAGTYVVHVRGESFSASRKMALLK